MDNDRLPIFTEIDAVDIRNLVDTQHRLYRDEFAWITDQEAQDRLMRTFG